MSELLIQGNHETNAMIERRLYAKKLANKVFDKPSGSKERWFAIYELWYNIWPDAKESHADAVKEAQELREQAVDPKFGRSKAAMGLQPDQPTVNKNTSLRVMIVWPEDLVRLLQKYDPLYLDFPTGTERRDHWRKLQAAFPAYLVPEQI